MTDEDDGKHTQISIDFLSVKMKKTKTNQS